MSNGCYGDRKDILVAILDYNTMMIADQRVSIIQRPGRNGLLIEPPKNTEFKIIDGRLATSYARNYRFITVSLDYSQLILPDSETGDYIYLDKVECV